MARSKASSLRSLRRAVACSDFVCSSASAFSSSAILLSFAFASFVFFISLQSLNEQIALLLVISPEARQVTVLSFQAILIIR